MINEILIMFRFYIKHYFCNIAQLHPQLLHNLRKRGLFPLKGFQEESLKEIDKNRNVFVNSCTGSGKTLSYLLPVMNRLLKQKDSTFEEEQRGAIILTLNKELVGQIYNQIVSIDSQNRLATRRIGSLSQSKQLNAGSEEQDQNNNPQGFINFILWNKIDILISTPQALMNQLTVYKGQAKNRICPQFLVVDQADLLLQLDKNVSRNTHRVISYFQEQKEKNAMLRYILTASSFPKKYKGVESEQKLKETFKHLTLINGVNKHKLPQKLELFYIEMKETQPQKLYEQKLSYLKRILNDRKQQRIMIFCKQKADIENLSDFIVNTMQIPSVILYAELRTQQRKNGIERFDSGQARVMICSELGSRGLNFNRPVDCIVQYDMAENIVSFINRSGRTARNERYGQVITFVEQKNKVFFAHLKQLRHHGEQFDEMFSRKRSYSKLYKQKSNEQ